MNLHKLRKANDLVADFKSAFLGSTRVTIHGEQGELLWSCGDDEWRDRRFQNLTVRQDVDMNAVLAALENLVG